jgi:hypothetical protein
VFALAFGTADAFYFPARGTLTPRLLPEKALLVGNATIQATNQLALFAGPLLAGSLISTLHHLRSPGAVGDVWGIGAAFAVDALTFLVSASLLSSMRTKNPTEGSLRDRRQQSLWSSMLEGLRMAKGDRFLRSTLLLIGAGNLLIAGPLYVGLPVLADTRYAGGARDLGLVLSLFGAGSLLGVVLAAAGRRLPERSFAWVMGGCPLVLGAGLVLLGFVRSAPSAAIVAAIMGLAQGYVVVQFLTILQRRTASHMLGRVMSLLTFLVVGLSPLSSGIAGAFLGLSVAGLMIGAGLALMAIVGAAFLIPSMRPFSDGPTSGHTSIALMDGRRMATTARNREA